MIEGEYNMQAKKKKKGRLVSNDLLSHTYPINSVFTFTKFIGQFRFHYCNIFIAESSTVKISLVDSTCQPKQVTVEIALKQEIWQWSKVLSNVIFTLCLKCDLQFEEWQKLHYMRMSDEVNTVVTLHWLHQAIYIYLGLNNTCEKDVAQIEHLY